MAEEHPGAAEGRASSRLTVFGLWITGAYVVGLAILIAIGLKFGFVSWKPVKINEIGDFLAGVFGPVAFLWLVLGFLQQGRELRLQVAEMAQSVAQQKELVGVTRETLEQEREVFEEARREKKEALRPRIAIDFDGQSVSSGAFTDNMRFMNVGPDLTDVEFFFRPSLVVGSVRDLSRWSSAELPKVLQVRFQERGPVEHVELTILCTNPVDEKYALGFVITADNWGKPSIEQKNSIEL